MGRREDGTARRYFARVAVTLTMTLTLSATGASPAKSLLWPTPNSSRLSTVAPLTTAVFPLIASVKGYVTSRTVPFSVSFAFAS